MSEIKLLPCPLCGNESEIRRIDDSSFYEIECRECCCKFRGYGEDCTIKEWNTRKPIERALERLEERKKNSLKSCETMSDSIIYRDAIEIIKEEVE